MLILLALYFPKKYFTYSPAYIWPGNGRFKKISILSIICFVEYQKNISIPNCYSVFSAVSKKRFISEKDGVFVARHIVTNLTIHFLETRGFARSPGSGEPIHFKSTVLYSENGLYLPENSYFSIRFVFHRVTSVLVKGGLHQNGLFRTFSVGRCQNRGIWMPDGHYSLLAESEDIFIFEIGWFLEELRVPGAYPIYTVRTRTEKGGI